MSLILLATLALAQTAPQPLASALVRPAEQELEQLHKQLTATSEALVRHAESPDGWKYTAQQGDILLQIALRSFGPARDDYLRLAVECYHGAAIQSPDAERAAVDRLAHLPAWLGQHFPASAVRSFAALQVVRADHARTARREKWDAARARADLGRRLVRFAQEQPKAAEAVPALREAAHLAEAAGDPAEACRCHRLVAAARPGSDAARQSRLAVRRLGGLDGEAVEFELPLLYPTSAQGGETFDLKGLRGKHVVVYFWTAGRPDAANGFEAVKRLTDRFASRGLEVVCVNLDADAEAARRFLSGRLLAATQVYLNGGLKSAVAEWYGLEALPEAFLVGPDGKLLRHSLGVAQLEAAVAGVVAGR